jgi:carboxy-terminal domain RNA polymerase II polypeptide A small phosphatase
MTQKLLILDLDKTLIYATETKLERPPNFTLFESTEQPYFVYKRPHLETFLEFCFANFEVAIWTSSSEEYAKGIVDNILTSSQKPVFVWSRSRCTYRRSLETYEYEWLKNLTKVKRHAYKLENVIMVDDTPAKLAKNYGNLVPVKSFEGNPLDDELSLLSRFLEKLKMVENIRKVEKRYWRNLV